MNLRIVAAGLAAACAWSQSVQLPLSGRTGPAGSAGVVQNPAPGVTTSVNTLNPAVQVQGSYAGSAGLTAAGESLALGLREAIRRALEFNLASAAVTNALRQAHGQSVITRSALLPNINAGLREAVQKTNLRALGVRAAFIPGVVGPFNYFDLRATLTQSLFDATARNNYRAARESVAAAQHLAEDTRDVVVLAVTGAYLQTVAAEARLGVARAQLDTARTLFDQASAMNREGVLATVDVNRSRVQMQVQQQRLTTLENDVAKQKMNLARMMGLSPAQPFTLSDAVAFSQMEPLDANEALKQAVTTRADVKAAEAQLRAAERARAAARAERLPALSVSADYGVIGTNPAQSVGTYTVIGSLRIPVWQGGRTSGSIEMASAVVEQRRAEVTDLRSRIEAEVRTALLDLGSAASQHRVAVENLDVARQSLDLTRQRFEAGVADTAELVRAQESIESAEYDVVSSTFSHNVAKAALARALGGAEQRVIQMLGLQ
jgi:outer membrane protein TolC